MRKWTLIVNLLSLTFAAVVTGLTYLRTGDLWLTAAVGFGALGYFIWTNIRGRRPKDTGSKPPY